MLVFITILAIAIAILRHKSEPVKPLEVESCPPHKWSTHIQGFLYCTKCKKLPGITHEVGDDYDF